MIFSAPYYRTCSDDKLVQAISVGEQHALNELYNRYSCRLLRYFYRMLGGDRDKAQDFLQEIFLTVLQKAHLYKKDYNFSTWIYTIAHNMCKNEYRRLKTENQFRAEINVEMNMEDGTKIERKIDNQIFEKAIIKELDNFDNEHKSTFLLRFQENLSLKQISKILNCAEGTIKSRIFYTTKKLANALRQHNYKF